ncbi:di-heme-cytochrome C peroxidase [Ruegeria meonggei]|uniref:di-heme-cytochrome C peroxidase n=1 Tax=Ruegeria meonggei TaxID=1446476 RepID=UPI00366FB2E9
MRHWLLELPDRKKKSNSELGDTMNWKVLTGASAGVIALGLVIWFEFFQKPITPTHDSVSYIGAYDGELVVPQNWDSTQRQEFWFTDQGSRIIPYVWFLHLEQPNGTARFSASDNLNKYRYLPQNPTELNPDGLPIGFTRGLVGGNREYGAISEDWLGLNCAACHSGQVEYQGSKYLIDGAPTMGDFQRMFRDLAASMEATLNDSEKFNRFAAAVIADNKTSKYSGTDNADQLRNQLVQLTTVRRDWNARNGVPDDYGYGRLDAVGIIVNEIAASGLGTPENISHPNAPVSYPFIWDTPQHDVVQWNGSVTNAGLGVITRNFTEVLGVFGNLEIAEDNSEVLSSSVNPAGLAKLEGLLSQLESPLWTNTDLPTLDTEMVNNGKVVFEKFCAGCHQDIGDRTDPARQVKAKMLPVFNPKNPTDPDALATDVAMAENFLKKISGAPGLISGAVGNAIFLALLNNKEDALNAIKAGQSPDVVAILDAAAAQHLDGTANTASVGAYLQEVAGRFPSPVPEHNKLACFPEGSLPCYKARPLNGIWATAPFLHNGSVRTMRQLLLPTNQRETSFQIGAREFDPVDMGFVNEGDYTFDTSLSGNSNNGHDGPIYGNAELSKDPTMMNALLEYLKSL